MKLQPKRIESPRFKTIEQFCIGNPAFTVGGVRHAIFYIGPKIEEAGGKVELK